MRALQFGDSMLPVGAFSFSNGVEAAVQTGVVRDLDTLRQFVQTATQQSATCDGIALLAAHRGSQAGDFDRVVAADRALLHRKMNEEMRTMTVRMGRKLAEMTVHVMSAPTVSDWLASIQSGETPGTYPIGQALVFAALGLGERGAFAVPQYGVATMIASAPFCVRRV